MSDDPTKASSAQKEKLKNFNLLYQRYRQARDNAKGRNKSMKDLQTFYQWNQRKHKNGNYDNSQALGQIGNQQFSCPDLALNVSMKNASMDILNPPL